MKTPFLASFLTLAGLLAAYDPPSDTAGPVRARMQAPAIGAYGAGGFVDLSRPNTPFTIPLALDSTAEEAIEGTARLAVIDRWRVDPASPVPFRLRPRGRARIEFSVSFGAGTHSAHYPVHAYVEFSYRGQRYTAHPILILQTRIPDSPRPRLPVEWKPVPVPKGGTLGLWRMPVRKETVEIASTGAEAGATGRETYDAASITQFGAFGAKGKGREGISMMLGKRPPSLREAVESAVVEYPVALPQAHPLRLEFAAMGDALFRVSVLPFDSSSPARTPFEQNLKSGSWVKASVDLNPFAGRSVRLRMEARGSSDEVFWAEPTVLGGARPQPAVFPPSGDAGARALGKAGGCEVRLWPGTRGLLDAPIAFDCAGKRTAFRGFRVRVAGDALEDWTASSEFVQAKVEASSGRHRVRHSFRNWSGLFDLLIELWVSGDALRAKFWLENTPPPQPWHHVWLEAVSSGPWSEKAARVYAGPGNVIVDPQPFRLSYNGHNMATSFVGLDFANGQALVQNSDAIPDVLDVDPTARIYSMVTPHAQTLEFFPAGDVWDAVRRIREQDTRQPSRGVAKLAGRFTFDIWGGRYGESARALAQAAKYGLNDAVVVWHNWQRWGYDYRLPELYPPSPQWGTTEEFKELVEVCRRNGILFAPHDNYIDFYPDAEGFSYQSIVFRQNGQPFRAWFNYGREAQSYRARADKLRPYVERNVRLIKEGFAPTSYFIDVWSSAAPYDYWTEKGSFVDRSVTRKVWGEVFAWIRETLGGDAPQLSEAGHDKLIGWLDGADAQQLRLDPQGPAFTWRIGAADSERIPWIDVAWHDKFILHGAGYEGRYVAGLDTRTHGMHSDDYMSVEILSGRPAMVAGPFSRDVVRKYWLLQGAARALALDRIASVAFEGGDIHRQYVKWERGGEVWVNRGVADWSFSGHVLPQYGFYARIPCQGGVCETAVEKLGGRVAEWSRSPSMLYVDGRGAEVDFGAALTSGAVRIHQESGGLIATPAPDSPSMRLVVRADRLPWKSGRSGDIVFECPAGQFFVRN